MTRKYKNKRFSDVVNKKYAKHANMIKETPRNIKGEHINMFYQRPLPMTLKSINKELITITIYGCCLNRNHNLNASSCNYTTIKK